MNKSSAKADVSGPLSPVASALIALLGLVAIIVVFAYGKESEFTREVVVSTNLTENLPPTQIKPLVHIELVDMRLRLRLIETNGIISFDRDEKDFQSHSRKEIETLKQNTRDFLKTADRDLKRKLLLSALSLSRAADNVGASINNLWILICFVLIFMMQPGFAFLESGLIRFTNVINVLFKNTVTTCISGLFFFIWGYSFMFNFSSGSSSLHGDVERAWLSNYTWLGGISPQVHFLFQLAFAMTAATIISGAVAGRITLWAYLVITACMAAFIYPISGWWAWSEQGWLAVMDYHDFAGSSVVHCVGGFAALAGVLQLGPRLTVFKKGEPLLLMNPQSDEARMADILNFNQASNKPHNVGFATGGTFLLWLGWFGFNGGSGLQIFGVYNYDTTHLERVGNIVMNTFIAGCAGGVIAMFASGAWTYFKERKLQLDLEDLLNGILAGCVAITAGCDLASPFAATCIGGLAGILVFVVINLFHKYQERLRIDDAVGAIAVHAACGIWGTLACGFIGSKLHVQALGLIIICGWSFLVSFLVFALLQLVGLLRVTPMQEICGLDRTYHGKSAYKLD